MKAISKDHLNLANDPRLSLVLNKGDKFQFTGRMFKFHSEKNKSECITIVTNKFILILKGLKKSMEISISNICGITKSLIPMNTELVIHLSIDCDLRLQSEFRDDIIEVITEVYRNETKKELQIYGVKETQLQNYVTTNNDRNNNITRIPSESDILDSNIESELDFNNKIFANTSKTTLIYFRLPGQEKHPIDLFYINKIISENKDESNYLIRNKGQVESESSLESLSCKSESSL